MKVGQLSSSMKAESGQGGGDGYSTAAMRTRSCEETGQSCPPCHPPPFSFLAKSLDDLNVIFLISSIHHNTIYLRTFLQ
jgi:hypothetical protein